MIVDLRFNGGGFARGAALTASYFLPEKPQRLLVRLENRDPSQAVEIRTEGPLEAPRFLDRPVFILTGAKTFSAAEMFASSLQQAGRATVVGARTRGGEGLRPGQDEHRPSEKRGASSSATRVPVLEPHQESLRFSGRK